MTNQRRINKLQGTINENSKIDFSLAGLGGFLLSMATIIIGLSGFYYGLTAQVNMLNYKVDQLSLKLDGYVASRITAATKMNDQTNQRTAQISELQRYVQQCCNVIFSK